MVLVAMPFMVLSYNTCAYVVIHCVQGTLSAVIQSTLQNNVHHIEASMLLGVPVPILSNLWRKYHLKNEKIATTLV